LAALPLVAIGTWRDTALGIVAATSIATWTVLLACGPRADAPARAGHLLAGLAFVAGGLVALAALRARPDGLAWAALVLVAAWSNDTGAFVGGKLLGKHRLLPAVSPGKTSEGLAIGAIAGVAGALAAHVWFDAISRDDAIAVGLITAVVGPIGDLSKSLVKRAAGVKDSGTLFLAHGGMLDRIDAVLFDALGVLAYVTAVHG
ncbi:MAG TPA: phosphatidate cytidylyltransferase, partial [Kofleriaceae bacterium]|nr:phosphatidate cytidylyltransferase [Kofleriaceae bacterium]